MLYSCTHTVTVGVKVWQWGGACSTIKRVL